MPSGALDVGLAGMAMGLAVVLARSAHSRGEPEPVLSVGHCVSLIAVALGTLLYRLLSTHAGTTGTGRVSTYAAASGHASHSNFAAFKAGQAPLPDSPVKYVFCFCVFAEQARQQSHCKSKWLASNI